MVWIARGKAENFKVSLVFLNIVLELIGCVVLKMIDMGVR